MQEIEGPGKGITREEILVEARGMKEYETVPGEVAWATSPGEKRKVINQYDI
jgi:hypothetical protein